MTVCTWAGGGKMSDLQSRQVLRTHGDHVSLLLNKRFSELIFWQCIVIMVTSAILLTWTPAALESKRLYLAPILVGTGLILVLTLLFRLRAYAQCRARELWIQVPFAHLSIPYNEIRATRPNDFYHLFPPKEQPRIQRRFLKPLLGLTAVVIDMEKLPRSKAWLRLWMSKYMILPDSVGLILPVRDWIAFRIELDDFRSRNRDYHY
jgi:hypothetical protein